MDFYTLVMLGAGASGGFMIGQWVADIRRARFHMSKVWKNRNDYHREG